MKRICRNIILLLFIFICTSTESFAQIDSTNGLNKRRIGFVSGHAFQNLLGINIHQYYSANMFMFQYYYALKQHKKWTSDVLLQPQLNTSRFLDSVGGTVWRQGIEFGINVGILKRRQLIKNKMNVYALLSTGPHYNTKTPHRQGQGFIFSDNLLFGLNITLIKDLYLDLRFGFRHMSNAGLIPYNGGINTFVFNGGIMMNLKPKKLKTLGAN